MKTVDKYQFNQDQPKFDSGIECFSAFHTVLKKYFTLKRICLTGDVDQSLYNYLIKEVSILKKLNHQSIYRCHKMLKTKNNLYLIYDNIEGDTLEKLLREKISFQTKLNFVKNICSALVQIRKNGFSHLAINTNNIIIQTENKLKIVNFGQALQITSDQQAMVLAEPIKTILTYYMAPQVYENKAHLNSDVYSFGMIIMRLFEKQFESFHSKQQNEQPSSVEAQWIQRLNLLASKMTIKIPEVRINIKQVESILDSSLERPLMTNKSFKSTKSQRYVGELNLSRRVPMNKNTSELTAKNDFTTRSQEKVLSSKNSSRRISTGNALPSDIFRADQKINEIQTLMKKVLKKRNFVVSLLYMAQACSNNMEAKSSTSIILSFLLIKKAAISISQLAKLLKLGKSSDIIIQKKLQEYFCKTNFFIKMNPIINKEMVLTQEMLQNITSEVTKLDCFSSNSLLMEEVRHQKMNNSYLRKCVFEFLNSLSLQNSTQYCQNYELSHVIGVYLISLLSSFKTYEEAHEALFSENNLNFEDDPLIKTLIQFKKETIFQLMEIDLELNEQKQQDNISLIKSSRTLK